LVRKQREDQFRVVFMKKIIQMKTLAHKDIKFRSTQNNLKYYEVLIIIDVVGSNIDPSCFMFIEHFLQDKMHVWAMLVGMG
jgi:hypothetical protein